MLVPAFGKLLDFVKWVVVENTRAPTKVPKHPFFDLGQLCAFGSGGDFWVSGSVFAVSIVGVISFMMLVGAPAALNRVGMSIQKSVGAKAQDDLRLPEIDWQRSSVLRHEIAYAYALLSGIGHQVCPCVWEQRGAARRRRGF